MEECCCDALPSSKEIIDPGFDAAVGSGLPCCEQLVEIRVDEDARQDTRISKPLEIRSDVDPPQAIVDSIDVIAAPPARPALVVYQPRPFIHSSGIDTYLITQRLRI